MTGLRSHSGIIAEARLCGGKGDIEMAKCRLNSPSQATVCSDGKPFSGQGIALPLRLLHIHTLSLSHTLCPPWSGPRLARGSTVSGAGNCRSHTRIRISLPCTDCHNPISRRGQVDHLGRGPFSFPMKKMGWWSPQQSAIQPGVLSGEQGFSSR